LVIDDCAMCLRIVSDYGHSIDVDACPRSDKFAASATPSLFRSIPEDLRNRSLTPAPELTAIGDRQALENGVALGLLQPTKGEVSALFTSRPPSIRVDIKRLRAYRAVDMFCLALHAVCDTGLARASNVFRLGGIVCYCQIEPIE
jgi:hypothetical protein